MVILTSSKEERDLMQGYRDGCNGYGGNPANIDELDEAARQFRLNGLLLNERPAC